MAFSIYKSGQGYWVRVMTATLIGIASIAFAAWGASQARAIVAQLPKTAALLDIKGAKADVPGNTAVTLMGPAGADGVRPEIGTAVMTEPLSKGATNDTTARTRIEKMALGEGKNITMLEALRDAGGQEFALVTGRSAQPPVQEAIVSAIVAAVFIIIGTILAYWLTAMRPRTVDFLISTDFEMKRVNWSTRREIVGSTIVVICTCFFLAGVLFLFDITLQTVFRSINLLQLG